MEIDVRTTPKGYDQSRLLYERSVADANESRVLSIGLDTAIDNLRGMISDGRLSVDDAIKEVEHIAKMTMIKGVKRGATDSFTDHNRILTTAMFARERMLAPLVYSLAGPEMLETRSRLSDGVEGTSTELINEYLGMLDALHEMGYDDQARHVRGVIQELTVASLLNFEQTSSRICVPATTYDDVAAQTDLYEYYYNPRTDTGYRHDISVKSLNRQKDEQLADDPYMIVVAAEEFGNLDLSISNLLVRLAAGSPGLDADEMGRLRMAKNIVVNLVKEQSAGREWDALEPMDDERLASQLSAA